MRSIAFLVLTTITMSGLFSEPLAAQQEYGWRGPGRSGIYNESGLLKKWPEGGPVQIWNSAGIGMGYSSATVTADALYITGVKGDKDVLSAFTLDGKKKWEVQYGTKSGVSTYPESRCTPTVSNGKVFVVSGAGELACISTEGKVVWSVDYFSKYNAPVPRFGICESPVVADNKVIVSPGGPKASMVAFNASNGTVAWEAESLNEEAQYVSPLLIDKGGKKLIITHTPTWIIAVNSADGKIAWKYNFKNVNANPRDGSNYIQTPLYRDGFLFAANGYGQTAAKLKLFDDGKEPELVWKNPEINPHVGGMVLLGDYIYSSTHDNNSFGKWICVDWKTGKTMWTTTWNNKGSVISADGMLIIWEERRGNIALVRPGPEKLDIVSEFRVAEGTGPYWSHPVVSKGILYLRHGDFLFAYNIKGQ